MVDQPSLNKQSTLGVMIGKKVPMFLGIPIKTLILSYHVLAVLFLLKLAMFDELLQLPYFVLGFGIVLLSYIRIDMEDKDYVKVHFWICLLLCAVPAAIIHIVLVGTIYKFLNRGFSNESIHVEVPHAIVASIFLMFFGVYIWMCRQFYHYLNKKPTLLPCHSQYMYEVHLSPCH